MRALAIPAIFVVLGVAVPAQADPQQQLNTLLRCASIADDAQRLACFDRESAATSAEVARLAAERDARKKQEAALAAQRAEAERVAAAERAEKAKVEQFGAAGVPILRKEAQDQAQAGELDELKAKVAEVFKGGQGELVLVLDNGQIWRQAEVKTMPPIRAGDPVTIKRRMISGFMLTLERTNRSFAVRRFR
jgi:hypothetical protein